MSKRDQKILVAYTTALAKVKTLCETETPFKKNEFCIENKVNKSYFFPILFELKVVETVISQHGEGVILKWLYKKASNEAEAFLANRVLDILADKFKANQAKQKSQVGKQFSRPVPIGTTTPYVMPVVSNIEDGEDTPEKALRKLLVHYQQEEVRLTTERNGLLKDLEDNENSLNNVTTFKRQLEIQLGL